MLRERWGNDRPTCYRYRDLRDVLAGNLNEYRNRATPPEIAAADRRIFECGECGRMSHPQVDADGGRRVCAKSNRFAKARAEPIERAGDLETPSATAFDHLLLRWGGESPWSGGAARCGDEAAQRRREGALALLRGSRPPPTSFAPAEEPRAKKRISAPALRGYRAPQRNQHVARPGLAPNGPARPRDRHVAGLLAREIADKRPNPCSLLPPTYCPNYPQAPRAY